MNVGSKGQYPANALSNFTPHAFIIDCVQCGSMEGFLQSLKFKSPEMQEHICTLVGYGAKKAGARKNWKEKQILWWRGQPIARRSKEYTILLTRAYDAMYDCSAKLRAALVDAGPQAVFTHSMGRSNENETVLTEREFCSQLHRLQRRLFNESE